MVNLMNNIYRKEWRQLANFFHLQIRLKSKERIGSKVKRKFHAPITPFKKLKSLVDEKKHLELQVEYTILNPFELRKKSKKKLRNFQGYNSRSVDRLGKHTI